MTSGIRQHTVTASGKNMATLNQIQQLRNILGNRTDSYF